MSNLNSQKGTNSTNSTNSTTHEYKTFRPIINPLWYSITDQIPEHILKKTETAYNNEIRKGILVLPRYELTFNWSNYLIPSDTKVCIIGQDCYHGVYYDFREKAYYPEAMGLSFSVPKSCHIPSSLDNIYKNLKKFSHTIYKPPHGDLSYWAYQGVLMLNCALSVQRARPNSHQEIWTEYTDELIKILSSQNEHIIFVLWGKYAHMKKLNLIIKNQHLHKFIISSHPSGYSANSPYREFKSFMDTDHFGLVNQYLKQYGKTPIDWQIM